jgi:hypothetical protein
MYLAWETGEIYTKFWSGNLKGRHYSVDVGADEEIILEWILGKQSRKMWTGFIWLRIGTTVMKLRFNKRWEISGLV